MTIPIRPGPFSFLATLGRAGGEAVDQAEKQRVRDLKENQDRLNIMINLRQQGLLDPSAFGTKEAMKLYKQTGIMPVSDQPTSAEQIESIRKRFGQPDSSINIPIPSLIGDLPGANVPVSGPSSVTDAQRAFAGLPSRSALGKEGAQAGAINAGGAAGRAVTGVPSEQVAASAEAGQVAQTTLQQTQLFATEAESFVAQALAGMDPEKMGVEAATQKAYQFYLQDSAAKKVAPLPPDVAERYFAQAVQKRIDYLQNQRIAAIRAANPGLINNPELSTLNVQIDNVNQELARLDGQLNAFVKSTGVDPQMAKGIIAKLPPDKAAQHPLYNAVQQYNQLEAQRNAKTTELRQLNSKYEILTQQRFGTPPVTGNPGMEQQRAWDAAAAYMREQVPNITGAKIVETLGPRP